MGENKVHDMRDRIDFWTYKAMKIHLQEFEYIGPYLHNHKYMFSKDDNNNLIPIKPPFIL